MQVLYFCLHKTFRCASWVAKESITSQSIATSSSNSVFSIAKALSHSSIIAKALSQSSNILYYKYVFILRNALKDHSAVQLVADV